MTWTNVAAGTAFSSAFASLATPLPFKHLTDTGNRSVSGTTFSAFPTISTLTFTGLVTGQVVELSCMAYFTQSGASGATVGRVGFIVDRPTSADVNVEVAIADSAAQVGGLFTTLYAIDEDGTHTFKVAGKSGTAANITLNGASATTRFWAKVLGTPTT